MHSGRTWRLGHRPALDGLRGVAILLVVISHLGVIALEPFGAVGVTVFFTLSGFLITALLLAEQSSRGRVSFRGFYRRRAVRLLPAFVVCMVAVIFIERWHYGAAPHALAPFLEVSNWVSATQGSTELLMFHHTWSLSIEEQFYALWPLVAIAVAARWGARGVLCAAATGTSLSIALGAVLSGPRDSFGTDTNAVSLLAGCALAALFTQRGTRVAPRLALPIALAAVAGAGLFLDADALRLVVVAATLAGIWFAATRSGGLAWWPLRYAGRVSYAWYLWNYPLTVLFHDEGWSLLLVPVVSFGLAVASWYLVEQPVIRLSRRQASEVTVMTAGPTELLVAATAPPA